MGEIEKMYENAGIKSFKTCEFCTQKNIDCLKGNISNITCGLSSDIYPPFTAEKQIAILQLLTQQCDLIISHFREWIFVYYDGQKLTQVTGEDFTETFAKFINKYWQDLTEEQKQQVKGILE